MHLQQGCVMTVLDFKALYPSINLEPCFCHLRDFLLNKISNAERKREQILELAHIATFSSIFNFNGVTYEQQRGVAMGSPISGLLCEMVLRTLEENIIPKYAQHILIYARYVDDVLVIWKNKPNIDGFVKDINSNNFGLEIELEQMNDRNVHFLDIDIQIDARDGVVTKVYRKPTYTPWFIPWDLHDPVSYKLAAYRALVTRAYTHCSKLQDRNEELKYINMLAKSFGVNSKAFSNLKPPNNKEPNRRKADECTIMEYRAQLNMYTKE
ncbi:uncharacterized protein [Centruroides vittatus]|uniref:uncharacterized protein n=1 Tax=Centruroides vittatus TaxID=120091 RepID=UPI00350ECEB3